MNERSKFSASNPVGKIDLRLVRFFSLNGRS